MYYFELYPIEYPGVIIRKFLLPFNTVEEAMEWVEKIKKEDEGYYMRWKETE